MLIGIAIIMYTVKQKISDSRNTEINNAEINNHHTAEIASINARIEIFTMEAQSILVRINNIEQIVNDLYEEKRLREEANRDKYFMSTAQSETAKKQNETESIISSDNSSSNISSEGVSYDIWTRFKQIVGRIMIEKNLTLDEACNRIAVEINDYGKGKICAQTVKNFYKTNNSHSKTLDKISVWVYPLLFLLIIIYLIT
ncbi:unnamed protein product [Rhizophagus irregularis]|uniref:Uncharacterized protein n=2 Tax=Rhizophagus irregularis TaxID=588596 RepID=A0A2I1HME7_9GLOM|nr:hypothetical protein RhiirA4_483320 [Rhizophagus irregularis]CAB4412175.1 unnamed protein product [Rhizophagus irregularis]